MSFRKHATRSFAFVSLVAVAACGGAPAAPMAPALKGLCSAASLETCERALLADLDKAASSRALAEAYAAALATSEPEGAWTSLARGLVEAPLPSGKVALVVEGGSARAPALPADVEASVRRVTTAELPSPRVASEDQLLLALAAAAGFEQVIRVDASAVTELYPRDPLAPFMAGLAPVARDDGALARLPRSIALAAMTRRAISAASRFDYAAAARETDALAPLLAEENETEPALRARYAVSLLSSAGISLDDETSPDAAAEAPQEAEAPPPAPLPTETPYGDWLRVRTAKDAGAVWALRRERILAAAAEDRRAPLDALFAVAVDCKDDAPLPPMETRADLAFAGPLSGWLGRTLAKNPEDVRAVFEPWLARYASLVRLADAEHAAWSLAPVLLAERGTASGLSPAGTNTYERVTELGLSHMGALAKLQAAFPLRFRALSLVAITLSPGVLADPRLRDEAIRLSQATVSGKLAKAEAPGDLIEALLGGAFAGMSYPPAVQGAYLGALDEAFQAQLKGNLTRQTGWSTAGLYAANAAFRVATGAAPDLGAASREVARALAGVADAPALAALATSAARYAALASEGKLDPDQRDVARFPEDRRAAREELRKAVAGLGEGASASSTLLDDIATLADGLIAAVAQDVADRAVAPSGMCPVTGAERLSPVVRRATARLADVRQRILVSPSFKRGKGEWASRARMLVTLLSDTLDVLKSGGDNAEFAISQADAERAVAEALAGWDERGGADVVTGGYALARAYLGGRDRATFARDQGKQLVRVLSGIGAFLRSDAPKDGGGVALLDALGTVVASRPEAPTQGLEADLLGYAKAFFDRGQRDQGDLLLMAALGAALADESPPGQKTIALGNAEKSRIRWAISFFGELARAKRGAALDTAPFAALMRESAKESCSAPSPEAVLSVLGAVSDFGAGRPDDARKALDRALEDARAGGLVVPKVLNKYEEKTATKVFTLSFDLSYGAGILSGASGAQVGVGLRTAGAPEGSLTTAFAATSGTQADEESARYYVQMGAAAAAYHFLRGDVDRATKAAQETIASVVGGVRLGDRRIVRAGDKSFGSDAPGLLALDAQLAAEAGLPFLAGDLWTIVRAELPPNATDAAVDELLAPLPLALAAAKDLGPLVERTKRSLRALTEPLACTTAKVDVSGYEYPSCKDYPLALSLRVADALPKLPRLTARGDAGSPACAAFASLDAFLIAGDGGRYDPDAFTTAVTDLASGGHPHDAAVLLTRQRNPAHCSPAIIAAARTLGRSPLLGATLRTDLLSVAVNCSMASIDDALIDDLLALDREARALPDLTRDLHVLLFVIELSDKHQRWDVLRRLTREPDFIGRFRRASPLAATAALLVDHAAAILSGEPVDLAKTESDFTLLCKTFPAEERETQCSWLETLRTRTGDAPADRKQSARSALKAVLTAATTPPR